MGADFRVRASYLGRGLKALPIKSAQLENWAALSASQFVLNNYVITLVLHEVHDTVIRAESLIYQARPKSWPAKLTEGPKPW